MEWSNPVIGRFAYSTAGRDKGRLFIVVNVIDEDFVSVADGGLRSIKVPKKKRIKHLKYTDLVSEEILQMIKNGTEPMDSDIRKAIIEVKDISDSSNTA
ncbi:MAG TPA: KOW domain-containing RNA-binding protein [Thermoclostridium sp.]|nr:KOW domain-containing RNA-binding protein [Thermoclostridium sp.]